MTILVVWSINPTTSKDMADGEREDRWETMADMAAAKKRFDDLCELENVYSASIVGVLESSDFTTYTLPELPAVDLRTLQAFLLLPKELRPRFMDMMPTHTNTNLSLALELLEKA